MRILLIPALLFAAAGWIGAADAQPATPAPPPAVAPAGPATPVGAPALCPPTAPCPPAPVAATALYPVPFAEHFLPHAGRLTLSNFTYGLAHVEALVTPYPDCAPHPGIVARDFKLPLNSTWVVPAPPGSDICWRRALEAGPAPGNPPSAPGWTEWNRVFTGPGGYIDARL